MISHYYDEAQNVLENAEIDEYYLSYLESLLRVKEHRDFALWARETERLVSEFEGTDDFYHYDLYDTSIATRDYSAAEELLSQFRASADDPGTIDPYTTKLRNSIDTYYFLGKQEEHALAASQPRSVIDGRRDPDGDVHLPKAIHDLALVEVAGWDTDEAMRLVRSWLRAASTDLADLVLGRSLSCAILGMAGALARPAPKNIMLTGGVLP